jgi:hypothetical protein
MLLYADEDFPGDVVGELRILGHDVLTAQQDGRIHRPARTAKDSGESGVSGGSV